MSLARDAETPNRIDTKRPSRFPFYLVVIVLVILLGGAFLFKNLNLTGDSSRHPNTGSKQTPQPALQTADDYVNLMNYEYAALRPDQRPIATVLHEELASLHTSGEPLATLNNVILPGLQKLQPGGDASQIRSAVVQCRLYATQISQRYQNIPNDLTAKLISVNVPAATASAVAKTFAEKMQTSETVARAAALTDVCDSVTSLLNLLSQNPTKWKRDSDGNLLSEDQGFTSEFNAGTQALNEAIRALNGEE